MSPIRPHLLQHTEVPVAVPAVADDLALVLVRVQVVHVLVRVAAVNSS